MKPLLSTYKILMDKVFNSDIDESWIDWAIEMIEVGYESDNLYMLAGELKPYNQFELQELATKVLDDLNLDYSDKEKIIDDYVYYLISTSIDKPSTYLKILRELRDICVAMDHSKKYFDFYELYYAKDDLLDSEVQWYRQDASRENIDQIIHDEFLEWKTKYETDKNS